MQRFSRKTLFAALLTIAWLGAAGVTPVAAEKPEERRQRQRAERAVEEKCSDYKRRHEDAKKAAQRAPRGQLEEALKKQDAALKEYCECLKYWFADAGIDPLPQKYEQLCNPKPIEDTGAPIPDEFRPDPLTPDTQAMPGDTGAPSETPMDPCEKLANEIKTVEEIQEHYKKNKWKLPEPIKKKLERLRKEYAQCQKPGAVPGEQDASTIRKTPQVIPPDKDQKPGTAPNPPPPPPPPPGGGAFSPAPDSKPLGCSSLDVLFGGSTTQEVKGATRFVVHNVPHAKHCDVCLKFRNGVWLRLDRDPNGCAVKVTVVDPPVPPIDCQARVDGGFDCGTVNADFCQMSPQVSIDHLKVADHAVEDLGLTITYPEDKLQICVHGRTGP